MTGWKWEPFKQANPESATCGCGSPATVNGECGACFGVSEEQLGRVENARVVRYRLRGDRNAPSSVVSIGSTQWTFGGQQRSVPGVRASAPVRSQKGAAPRKDLGRHTRQLTNGDLVQLGLLAVIGFGVVIGSVVAVIALGLVVVAVVLRRWVYRGRTASGWQAEPTGLRRYLRDVGNAILEIDRMAWGLGQGSLTTWQAVKHAASRAWLTIKGNGDQGRCSNGKFHCGQCANCRVGEEWD